MERQIPFIRESGSVNENPSGRQQCLGRGSSKNHFDAVRFVGFHGCIIAFGRCFDSGKDKIEWRKRKVCHAMSWKPLKEIKKSGETRTDSGDGVGEDWKLTC